ncbi:PREDICTED: UDP-glucuronosyltransferase 2B20 isoform X1 [Eufriesea mexicana]|uniref:UDP-glucuronosyltransferase 2B20 isoform X1 n=1 Tax=Eufriesea mexicana TaxID=516756 RepID=UPI00083BB74D|nr:PREDICTED: UDP-glucuronosyltransferase 2B20 isoform X1 [Eufriesea mexicana]XP_017767490.1 PREDICTED: UDP-glucuronosyltransferase 2B20 isoform X1 [Eufriesea mexicana]XP_017767500.1 PREDICTED: UDP-glucuronosyltransferase 2B20 isoform X1 [Eufriesea mexicana]XP_017767508.1 PREDICTED: UDP-glucuronosyltransferase 2B20 isoform X1 [Eufriesea mexicana]XP_017767517.1 PREDICTED: UDP-glucuronosyltransferase 2B20 isoform X1 [Eufriesea mexicana]
MWITKTRAILLFLLVFLASTCSGATNSAPLRKQLKILAIFGHPGKSHFDVFKPLVEELARRGHGVTVISHFPRTEKAIAAEPLPTYKDISLVDENLGVFVNVVDLNLIDNSYTRIFKNMYMLYFMSNISCTIGLQNAAVKQLLASGQKFDVLLTESFNTNCFMGLVYRINAPFIQISTHQLMPWVIDELGLSQETSYVPALLTRLPKPMNLFERMSNLAATWFMSAMFHTFFDWRDRSLIEKNYGPGTPDLQSISNNASLIFVNTHYTIHGSTSYQQNVIEIGGLHIPPSVKPLPKNIAKFLDEAHEGVLYFNLGSMVKTSSMPKDKLDVLLKVLGSIPRKVIWKWEADDMPDLPSNIFILKWLPQYDILNHPNVRCYFGHGGLLGLSEGVQSGVPMVLMPFFGDQYQNSMAARARGVAVMLDYAQLSEETVRHALDEVFNNTRYYENAKRLSKAFRDRPASPLDTAVWWTEYVGRGNGVPYLKSDAANMSWCQRNLIDVAVVFLLLLLLVLYVTYRVFRRVLAMKTAGQKKRETSKKTN